MNMVLPGRCVRAGFSNPQRSSFAKASEDAPPSNELWMARHPEARRAKSGAVEKTRTSTGCPTATSTLRVYQFRHDRTPRKGRSDRPGACSKSLPVKQGRFSPVLEGLRDRPNGPLYGKHQDCA